MRFTAPAAGRVSAVHRGPQRAFLSLVIDVAEDDGPDAQVAFESLARARHEPADGAAVRALLLESGMWTALRTRPFSHVPAADAVPQAIFVTAVDTHPHAPDPQVVLAERGADFAAGMGAIEKLTPGPVYLCRAAGSPIAAAPGSRAEVHEFAGPHPAGTPACTSTACIRSMPGTPSGTSAIRTWLRSATC